MSGHTSDSVGDEMRVAFAAAVSEVRRKSADLDSMVHRVSMSKAEDDMRRRCNEIGAAASRMVASTWRKYWRLWP